MHAPHSCGDDILLVFRVWSRCWHCSFQSKVKGGAYMRMAKVLLSIFWEGKKEAMNTHMHAHRYTYIHTYTHTHIYIYKNIKRGLKGGEGKGELLCSLPYLFIRALRTGGRLLSFQTPLPWTPPTLLGPALHQAPAQKLWYGCASAIVKLSFVLLISCLICVLLLCVLIFYRFLYG